MLITTAAHKRRRLTPKKVKRQTISVTGRGGPMGCETSRWCGEVVSLTHQPPFTPRKIPGTHFRYRLSRPQGHSAAARIRSIEKCNDLLVIRTRNLSACSIVPLPTTLPPASKVNFYRTDWQWGAEVARQTSSIWLRMWERTAAFNDEQFP
jgi:hypothetical protein